MCDVDSHDLWIKFKLVLDSPFISLDSELELKVDKDMSGKHLQNMI